MRRLSVALLVAVVVGSSLPASSLARTAAEGLPSRAAREPSGEAAARGSSRWIVTLREGTDAARFLAPKQGRLGFRADRVFRHVLRGFSARLTPAQRDALRADPSVETVQPDLPLQLAAQSLPPGVDRVDADISPVAGIDGSDERVDADVAIVDTGVDPNHPDLNVVGGYDCTSGNPQNWKDENGHGTHVAGIAAALDNDLGVVGVAPGTRIWSVRVFPRSGDTWRSWIVCGLDWIAAQRDPADPSRPLIEAVNMSLRGSGGDDGRCGAFNQDALHAAVCRVVEAGTTVVVAAGNDRNDAKWWVPASYDEAITVSALADHDGMPGGLTDDPCHPPGLDDLDDTFANFSNYGADVDLIAPGACVRSTYLGGGYQRISGTSMAAPTVAGAAALYLASHPGASPATVRSALVADATSNWRTSTDPDGIPDPLLNVAGFSEAADFSLAAGPRSLMRGPGETAVYQVEIARRNGFGAPVTLAVSGLPPGATAVFEPAVAVGVTGTSAALRVTAPSGGDTASPTLTITGTSDALMRSTTVRFIFEPDLTSTAGGPTVRLRGPELEDREYPITVSWAAIAGATEYQLQLSRFDGPWSTVTLPSRTTTSLATGAWPGHSLRYRVRGRVSGAWGGWRAGTPAAVVSRTGPSDSIVFAGDWRMERSDGSLTGRTMYAVTKGPTATLTFTGRELAWVSTRAPNRGKAKVYLDGAYLATVDLWASSAQERQLVFTRRWSSVGDHTLLIRPMGIRDRPRVDVDAIVLVIGT